MSKILKIFCLMITVSIPSKILSQTGLQLNLNPNCSSVLLAANLPLSDSSPAISETLDYFNNQVLGKKPRPASHVIPVQVAGGTLGGLIIGIGSGLAGMAILADIVSGTKKDPTLMGGFATAGYLGYIYGSSYFVNGIGEGYGLKSSKTTTLLGSVVGSLIGFSIAITNDRGWGLFAGPPVLATISFQLTRKK